MNTVAGLAQATLPDYRGGGIVNLMASIAAAFGAEERVYPALRARDFMSMKGRPVLFVLDPFRLSR